MYRSKLNQEPIWLSNQGFRYMYCPSLIENSDISPIFFVNGAFQSMKSWHRAAQYFLRRGIPVILADLPGTGEADLLPTAYGLDFLSDSLKMILDHIGCKRVSIVSASYGTPIGYYFARKYASMVESLVLAGTMKEIPCNLRHGVEHTLVTLREGNMEQFANEVVGLDGPQKGNGLLCFDPSKPIDRRDLAYRVLTSQLVNMNDTERQRYEINTLRLLYHEPLDLGKPPQCRTLVYTGEHDTFTRPNYCKRIAESIPNSTFTTIKRADHLFVIEQFEVVTELVLRFTQQMPMEDLNGINEIETTLKLSEDLNLPPKMSRLTSQLSMAA